MNQEVNLLSELYDFFYPQDQYYGQFNPEYLAFNANLQDFAQRVSHITNLQTVGKLSPQEAYKQIHLLWKQLKRARKEMENRV
jgi:hypothetical protein